MILRLSVECWDILTLFMPGMAVKYMDWDHIIALHNILDVLEQKQASIIAPFRIIILYRVTLQELYVQVQQVHFINNLLHINNHNKRKNMKLSLAVAIV